MRMSEADGRKVVSVATAETVGQVDGHLIDATSRAIAALKLKKTPSKAEVLPWASLQAFGDEAVMIPSVDAIVAPEGRIAELGDKRFREHGKRVLSSAGVDLGEVDDVEFDPDDGRVTGLVIGSTVIDGERLLAIGSYAVIVQA